MSEVKHIRFDEDGNVLSEDTISKTAIINKKYDKRIPYSQQRAKQSKVRAKEFKGNHRDEKHPERWFYDLLIKRIKTWHKFIKYPRTQVVIFHTKTDYYILDIFFEDLKLVIELDGKSHEGQKEWDNRRDRILKENKVVYMI